MVNEGVRAYQFLIYLILVEEYFGPEIRRQVHEHQINVLGEISDTCGSIEHAFELIVTALATKEIRISTEHGDVDVPLEMNIALLLLLTSPRSPDYSTDPEQHMEQIYRISKDVDWCFSEGLIRGRKEIKSTYASMFSETLYAERSTRVQ